MPDGAVREGKKWLTSPMDIAKEISQGLANNALIAEVSCGTWLCDWVLEQYYWLKRSLVKRFRCPKHSAELWRLQVNGVLWDMTRPLEEDCKLAIFNFDTDKGRDTFWHSSAHILGQVWEWLWNFAWYFLHSYFVSLPLVFIWYPYFGSLHSFIVMVVSIYWASY